jgi:hypothetical protein
MGTEEGEKGWGELHWPDAEGEPRGEELEANSAGVEEKGG